MTDEFTDYRTYMDYDIRIAHRDGNYSLYSKVCEEKSGGETQTPFYVTVAASFVQRAERTRRKVVYLLVLSGTFAAFDSCKTLYCGIFVPIYHKNHIDIRNEFDNYLS